MVNVHKKKRRNLRALAKMWAAVKVLLAGARGACYTESKKTK